MHALNYGTYRWVKHQPFTCLLLEEAVAKQAGAQCIEKRASPSTEIRPHRTSQRCREKQLRRQWQLAGCAPGADILALPSSRLLLSLYRWYCRPCRSWTRWISSKRRLKWVHWALITARPRHETLHRQCQIQRRGSFCSLPAQEAHPFFAGPYVVPDVGGFRSPTSGCSHPEKKPEGAQWYTNPVY